MKKSSFAALLVTVFAVASPTFAGDVTSSFEKDDNTMTDAVVAAVDALPLFLAHTIGSDGVSHGSAAVKIAVKVDAGHVTEEVIWVTPFMMLDDEYGMGVLANAPNDIEGKSKGDMIEFRTSDILDWSFQAADRKLYGNYTSRVQLNHLDASYDWLRDALSEEPVPAAWLQ